MLRRLLSVLVPPLCLACRAPGTELCAGCRRALAFLRAPLCPRCGLPAPCGARCPAASAAFAAAWAPVAYAGSAPALVAALKFRARLGVGDVMASQIAVGAPPGLLAGTLVPVPTHPARRRARGFDQAAVIARALSRRSGLEVRACLRRTGAPTRQLGAARRERLAVGRLDVVSAGPAPGRCVLVDDVHTTGATLDACARALRAAGAGEVVAATWARAL